MVNPHQFQVISKSVKKTDERDAETLALFLSKGMLPEVRMKQDEQAQMASLVQTRDKLVKLRTTLKNKVNNILAAQGILLKKEGLSSEKGLAAALAFSYEPMIRIEVEVIIEQIRSLTGSIEKLSETIKTQGEHLSGQKNLKSITGIGSLGASILM